ncbi:MAG: hypothetical protein KDI05_05520 [Halieaceae bacterium]|nr:hypothetical protein [Halieaceae bacterium]MCP5203185.1 hypothetical protein [Pseudomonadales bacterium]
MRVLVRTVAPALGIALLVAGGCATSDKPQAAANPVDADGLPVLTEEQKAAGIVCVRESVTGSRLSKKRCTTREQRERDQQRSQEEIERITRQKPGPVSS